MRRFKKFCNDLKTIGKWYLFEWIEILKVVKEILITIGFIIVKIIMGMLNCIFYLFIMTRKMAIRRFLFDNFGLITAITCNIKREVELEKEYSIYFNEECKNSRLYSVKSFINKKSLIIKTDQKELKYIMSLEDTVGYFAEPFNL